MADMKGAGVLGPSSSRPPAGETSGDKLGVTTLEGGPTLALSHQEEPVSAQQAKLAITSDETGRVATTSRQFRDLVR